MASDRPAPTSPPEEQFAQMFRLSGYEVQQTVGLESGTIDWFATPTTGFVRPRTYFRVLSELPEDIEEALAELESARVARGADRAIAIIDGKDLPAGYAPDLPQKTSNVPTKKGGTGKPRGTGLGLAIARRYAEAMGGRVGLDAEQDETCFFVDLVPWRDST